MLRLLNILPSSLTVIFFFCASPDGKVDEVMVHGYEKANEVNLVGFQLFSCCMWCAPDCCIETAQEKKEEEEEDEAVKAAAATKLAEEKEKRQKRKEERKRLSSTSFLEKEKKEAEKEKKDGDKKEGDKVAKPEDLTVMIDSKESKSDVASPTAASPTAASPAAAAVAAGISVSRCSLSPCLSLVASSVYIHQRCQSSSNGVLFFVFFGALACLTYTHAHTRLLTHAHDVSLCLCLAGRRRRPQVQQVPHLLLLCSRQVDLSHAQDRLSEHS